MKFLVILICVTANNFWRADYSRFNDTWFIQLRQGIDKITSKFGEPDGIGWAVGLLAIFLLPMTVLLAVLVFIDDLLFGLLTLLVHVFVVLMVFDRIHPGSLAEGYLKHWREGNLEGSLAYLKQELDCSTMPQPADLFELHHTFCKLYVYRCFEKMFVMFFWYMLSGPMGVMFAYICYQHRDGDIKLHRSKEIGVVTLLIEVLEWAPVRLLGLTLSLAGDFEAGFKRLRKTGLNSNAATDDTVYEYSMYALGLIPQVRVNQQAEIEENPDVENIREKAVLEVDSLQALMERSQIIWLCLIALFTILGLGL